jgi:hypothetical protein
LWRLVGLLHDATIDTDGAYYGAVTRWFAAGHFAKALDPVWPPLLPFLASLLVRAGVPLEAAGVAVSLASSTACIVTIALLARAAGGAAAGRWGAWLAAVHPKLVSFGLQFLTEALYIATTSAALVVAIRAGGARRAACTGLCLGAAFLVRPEAVALLPALAVWHGLRVPRSPRTAAAGAASSRRTPRAGAALAAAAAVVIGFACMTAPYMAQVARIERRVTLGEKGGLNFYLAYRDHYARAGIAVEPSDFAAITAPEMPRRPGDYRVGEFLRRQPAAVAGRVLANLPRALADKMPGLVGWPVFALAVLGIAWRRRVPRHPMEALFAAWILCVVLSIAPLFPYRRFFAATLPPLLVWAAIALVEIVAWGGRRARVGVVTGVLALALAAQVSVWRREWPRLYRDAGGWLAAHAPQPVVVAARKPESAFYAGAEFRPLAATDIGSLRIFLHDAGATHFVAEDYILPQSHPALAALVDPEAAPDWLRPVHAARDARHRIVVYAFEPR